MLATILLLGSCIFFKFSVVQSPDPNSIFATEKVNKLIINH